MVVLVLIQVCGKADQIHRLKKEGRVNVSSAGIAALAELAIN